MKQAQYNSKYAIVEAKNKEEAIEKVNSGECEGDEDEITLSPVALISV